MSIVQMQKVTISALREDRKAILEKLQAMGVMEVHPIETDEDFTVMDTTAARQSFDRNVSLIENALGILDQYAPEKKSMFSSLNGKEAISGADVTKIAKKRDLAVDIAARIVRNEKNIAEKVVDFAQQLLLLHCEGKVILAQEENIRIVAEYPAVQVAAEHAVVDCVLCRRNLTVYAEFIIELAAVNKVHIAAYAAGINHAEGGAQRHAAAEEQLILTYALPEEVKGFTHNLPP